LGYLHSEIGSDLSELLSWDEEALFRLVKRQDSPTTHQELELLFPLYQKELQKVGVTRLHLWQKYCLTTPHAVTYSRFCRVGGPTLFSSLGVESKSSNAPGA
jgi:hypothetical protein